MITPAHIDLAALRRVPFEKVIAFEGLDFGSPSPTEQAASFIDGSLRMECRLYPDAEGDAPILLANAFPADEGLSFEVTYTDGMPTTFVKILITQAKLEVTLPLIIDGNLARKFGTNAVLYYDIKGKPLGRIRSLIARGKFTIEGSVTHG